MQTGQKVWRLGEEAEARAWAHPTHLSAALRYMSVCERDNRQARRVAMLGSLCEPFAQNVWKRRVNK